MSDEQKKCSEMERSIWQEVQHALDRNTKVGDLRQLVDQRIAKLDRQLGSISVFEMLETLRSKLEAVGVELRQGTNRPLDALARDLFSMQHDIVRKLQSSKLLDPVHADSARIEAWKELIQFCADGVREIEKGDLPSHHRTGLQAVTEFATRKLALLGVEEPDEVGGTNGS